MHATLITDDELANAAVITIATPHHSELAYGFWESHPATSLRVEVDDGDQSQVFMRRLHQVKGSEPRSYVVAMLRHAAADLFTSFPKVFRGRGHAINCQALKNHMMAPAGVANSDAMMSHGERFVAGLFENLPDGQKAELIDEALFPWHRSDTAAAANSSQ